MDKRKQLMKRLVEARGVSGNEEEIVDIMADELSPIASISRGGLGSCLAEKGGEADTPRVMLAGHMDEIGFMVKGFTDQGYIKFNTVGGWWGHVLLGQRVVIHTREGEDVIGVIGAKAPHSLPKKKRKKVMKTKDMFIDIGATSENEIKEKSGIKPGDFITPFSPFQQMIDEDMYLAKAWDDRIGVATVIEVLKNLKEEAHENTVIGVGTVQEEVGLRGAKTSAYKANPDVAFAIDVTIAQDIPGSQDSEYGEKMGEGPSISLMDASVIPNKNLRNFVIDVAEDIEVPYQTGSLAKGGTDSGRIHLSREGIPTLTFSVPSRYIHSHSSVINRQDFDNLVEILTEVVLRLDEDTVNQIMY